MKIVVVGGLGVVGSAVVAYFYSLGHEIVVNDIKGGEGVVTDIQECLGDEDFIFVCVPTSMGDNGSIDLTLVENVTIQIGLASRRKNYTPNIIYKSTMVPGSTFRMCGLLEDFTTRYRAAYNPEFIRQRCAVEDMMRPNRIVVGALDGDFGKKVMSLYDETDAPKFLFDGFEEAELVKYYANCYYAARISFFNQMKFLSDRYMCNHHEIVGAVVADKAVGLHGCDPTGEPYGGACLLPTEEILTIGGYKKIKDIKVGDTVLTHKGNFKRVTETFKRKFNDTILDLKTTIGNVRLTSDHPIYAVKRKHKGKQFYKHNGKQKMKTAENSSYNFSWLDAGVLERGDFMSFPVPKLNNRERIVLDVPKNKVPAKENFVDSPIEVTPNFMRLLGYYIAEGWYDKSKIGFAFHTKEKDYHDDVINLAKKCFMLDSYSVYTSGNKTNVLLNSSRLSMLFKKYYPGKSYSKKLPQNYLFLSKKHLKEFICGLFRGDGSISGGRYTWATVSKELFDQVKIILLKIGIAFTTKISPKHRGKDGVLHRESYYLSITTQKYMKMMDEIVGLDCYNEKKKNHMYNWFSTNKMIMPIRKITKEKYTGYVYNIEVEDDNSYVTRAGSVHNCLPKDLSAIIKYGEKEGIDTRLLKAVKKINDIMKSKKEHGSMNRWVR